MHVQRPSRRTHTTQTWRDTFEPNQVYAAQCVEETYTYHKLSNFSLRLQKEQLIDVQT